MSTLTMELPATSIKTKRIESIDLLRGLVIIIMALDHVRDYFHADAYLYNPTNLAQTSAFLFFTRWITHFCAPVFAFLAGTSAYLNGLKKTKKELSVFLLTRGLWLVILEFLIITLEWTFNAEYNVFLVQVIWSLGISMIFLAGLIHLPRKAILVTGIILIAAHNLLDNVHVPGTGASSIFWAFLHEQRFFTIGNTGLFVGYPIIPWIGIMATGYCFGTLYTPGYDAVKRKRTLIYLGTGAIALFIILRGINLYGDPSHWSAQKDPLFSFLSFLNTSKYPPSLLYALMTLGPSFLFLAFAEGPLNGLTKKLVVVGRVPMFFYILHIAFIHLLAVFAALMTGYKASDMVLSTWVTDSPQLRGYGFNLLTVYLLWIAVVIALYPLCKWYDAYKRSHREKQWLSYI
ncbi:MAG TPA: heparan-alpha-glucosaminide N-acetyltransferase domain-containing protein [Chitinophaga sp.]